MIPFLFFFYPYSIRLLSFLYPFSISCYPFSIRLLSFFYAYSILFLSLFYPFPILLRSYPFLSYFYPFSSSFLSVKATGGGVVWSHIDAERFDNEDLVMRSSCTFFIGRLLCGGRLEGGEWRKDDWMSSREVAKFSDGPGFFVTPTLPIYGFISFTSLSLPLTLSHCIYDRVVRKKKLYQSRQISFHDSIHHHQLQSTIY